MMRRLEIADRIERIADWQAKSMKKKGWNEGTK
jgi:hypothetical protein